MLEFPFLVLNKNGLPLYSERDFEIEEKDRAGLEEVFIEDICKLRYWKYRRNPNLLRRDWFENCMEEILDYIEFINQTQEQKGIYDAATLELSAAHMYQFFATLILETDSRLPDKVKDEVLKSTTWEFEARRGWKNESLEPRKNFLNVFRDAVLNCIPGIKRFFPNSPPWQRTLERYVTEVKEVRRPLENMVHPLEITHLDLSEYKLKSIPNEVFFLSNLVKLNLNDNDLEVVPKEIRLIKSLRELHLAGKNLLVIPREIGNLTNLEVFDLSHNKLTSLPEEVGNLYSLRRFLLIRNNLTKLPSSLNKIASLYRVEIMGNPIDYDELNSNFPNTNFL